jgi:hypothetical protein
MNTRGFKWPAVGLVCLLLVALGAHLAWEQHRYRLVTPKGTIRVGMTLAEAREAIGSPRLYKRDGGQRLLQWAGDGLLVEVTFGEDGRLANAWDGDTSIPRPSLLGHVRSWLPGWLGGE